MTSERFADLLQTKDISRQNLQPGDRIQAVVVGISGENIFLDIGGKSEGVLDAAELQNEDGIEVEEGDTLSVFFLGSRKGELTFTTRIGSGQASLQEIEDAYHAGIPVEGRVTAEIRGGFQVMVAGQRAFCPYSQMDIRRIEEPESYLDRTCSFKVIEYSQNGRNIILSARAVLEEERQVKREHLMATLREGDRVQGTVTSIRDFGAFVDIGGVDGLIPLSELAWGQTDRVDDLLSPGQEVEVIVKRLDWESDRIALSLKETTENPWDRVPERYPEGSIHQGQVSRLAAFGAFVTLEPGVDGLLHISKLGAGRRINHPREVLEPGQDITVKIEEVDQEKKRIALVPEDYTESRKNDTSSLPRKSEPVSMGTLGDLLQAQLGRKTTR